MLEGFIYLEIVKELKLKRFNWDKVPMVGGVYAVVYKKLHKPNYSLPEGIGGYFKGKNPNVSKEKLNRKWIKFKPGEDRIIYIGKAGGKNIKTTLRNRIKSYIRFGNGKRSAHWGGRYIWQIADSDNLKIYWKKSDSPEKEEKKMLVEFKNIYNQKLPFANIRM